MDSITLVRILLNYFSLLGKLEAEDISHFSQNDNLTRTFWKSVSLRYNTLTLELHSKEEGVSKALADGYFNATFHIEDKNVSLTNLYCSQEGREHKMREYILHHMPTEFRSTESEHTDVLTEEVAHYLTMADEIAKQVYLCSAGDDYRPGYYSEISIDDYGIRLKQINYHNARSIKHKQDYYMRTLEFYIPLTTEEPKLLFQQEKIGKMLVEFSDSSSEHNKVCGNKILEKLKEARLKFEV